MVKRLQTEDGRDSNPATGADNHWDKASRYAESVRRNFRRYKRILTEEFPVYLKAPGKKPLTLQIADLYRLYRAYNYIPYQYIKHNLYLKKFGREIYRYIPTELLHVTRDSANAGGDPALVEDKLLFERTMRLAGIATTRTMFLLSRDGICDMAGGKVDFEAFVSLIDAMKLPNGIIVKPLSGGSGSAVFKLEVVAGVLRHAGEPLDRDRFLALVFATNNGFYWDRFIVQEAILQHPGLSRFNATSVNTVRIDTFVDDEGQVRFNAAALKVGAPGSITDNATTGGYMIAIDLETGRFSSGAKTEARFGGQYHDLQSVFGVDPAEFTMPFWSEVRATAVKAAGVVLPFRSLGWDIAITSNGPLVVETNADYGVDVLQELAGGYVDKALGRAYLDKHRKSKLAVLGALEQERP